MRKEIIPDPALTRSITRPRTAIRFNIRDEEPFPLPGIRSVSYFDSVQILRKTYFRAEFRKFMEENCGKAFPPTIHRIPGVGTFTKMWLHQPNVKAVVYLEDKGCSITRVHVALDIMPGRMTTARSLHSYLARTYQPDSSPDYPIVWIPKDSPDATAYFRFKNPHRPGMTTAVYADSLSKVEGVPCCHLEVRVNLSKYLAQYALATPHDLLNLDHRKFWEHRLVLKEAPTAEQLGAAWMEAKMSNRLAGGRHLPFRDYSGLNGMRKREYSMLRVGEMLRRAAQDRNGDTCAHDLLWFLTERRPLRTAPVAHLFKAVNNSWLLPPVHNGLWGSQSLINQQVTEVKGSCIPLSCPPEDDIPY